MLFTSGETRLTEPHTAPDTSFTWRRRGASLLPRVSQITGHSPQTLCPAVGTGAGWVSDEPGASCALRGGKCPPQVPRTPRNTLAFKLLPTQPAFSAWPSSPPAARSLKAPRPPRPSWLTASYLQTTAPAARPGALPRSHVDSGLFRMAWLAAIWASLATALITPSCDCRLHVCLSVCVRPWVSGGRGPRLVCFHLPRVWPGIITS